MAKSKEAPKKNGPIKARTFDFSDVKEGGGGFRPKRKPEGDYRATIAKVEEGKSKSGNEQWVFTIQLTSDKSATYGYYCGFDAKQMFKLYNLVVAAGMKAPKAKVAVDPKKLIGKEIGVRLEDDEYEGKPKSTIDTVFPASDLTDEADEPEDDEDESDEDEVDTDEDDSDDEDTEDESDDEDEEEDSEDDDEEDDDSDEDDDEDTDDSDDEEEDEDDEPEPEPEPVKKKKAAPAPVKKATKKAAEPVKPAKKGKVEETKATKKAKKKIDLDDL